MKYKYGVAVVAFLLVVAGGGYVSMEMNDSFEGAYIEVYHSPSGYSDEDPVALNGSEVNQSEELLAGLREAKKNGSSTTGLPNKESVDAVFEAIPDEAETLHEGEESGYYLTWEGDEYIVKVVEVM